MGRRTNSSLPAEPPHRPAAEQREAVIRQVLDAVESPHTRRAYALPPMLGSDRYLSAKQRAALHRGRWRRALARYHPDDGAVDTSCDVDGMVLTDSPSSTRERAFALARYPAGDLRFLPHPASLSGNA